MKVILTEDIKSLGLKGDIKDVSDGYATNFLLAQDKAILATKANIANYKAQKNKAAAKTDAQSDGYQKISRTLNKQGLSFIGKVSDKNILFKGISTSNIIIEIKNKFNLDIHDNWFVKPGLLKEVGKHTIFLRLPDNQLISFFINIKPE